MNKVRKIFVLQACLMALALSQAPCQAGGGDTWANVARMSQLDGKWGGITSSTMTFRQFMERQGTAWTSDFQRVYGNMNVKVSLILTMSVNAARRAGTISGYVIFTFSGGNLRTSWPDLRDALISDGGFADDADFSIASQIEVSDTMTDSEIREYKISQNGKKIRVPFSKVGVSFLPNDFVLTKQ